MTIPPPSLPFVDLKTQYARLKPRIDARIQAVLDHGRYVMGPEIGELECALAGFAGVPFALAVSSGTDALLLALMAEEIGPGDAVFLPGFTFTATAEVIAAVGATPVFVDVAADTFNIDPDDLERRVARVAAAGEVTPRAVIAVDLFGLPADYPAIAAIAERYGLFVIADAAQSFGAAVAGLRVGGLAPVTCVSFFPSKPLGCYGDGGAVLTLDQARFDRLSCLRIHGQGAHQYDIVRIGRNARMDTIQAAVLLVKLETFADDLARRETVAARYRAGLRDVVSVPLHPAGVACAWAQYTLRVEDRDGLRSRLQAQGIPTGVYYPRPLHLQPAFLRWSEGPGSLPVSEALCGHVLSLPVHPELDDATVDRVIEAVRAALVPGEIQARADPPPARKRSHE